MADTTLRPRSPTELVDAAVQLLRRHYVPFMLVSGIGMIPFLLLRPLLSRSIGADGSEVSFSSFLSFAVLNIVTSMWYSLAGAAIIAAAAEAYVDGRIDVGAAITKVTQRVPAVLYASFVKGFAVVFGLFLFLVGSAYFYSSYFAVPTTIMVENLSGRRGVARSKQLARGHRWSVLKPMLLVLVIYLVVVLAAGALSGLLFGTQNTLASEVLGTLITVLVYPIVPITEMLVYFDLRIRHEGYDVEVMAARLTPAGSAPA